MAYVLTERQRDVLAWLAQGKTSWKISAILGITERAVNADMKNAARKLDAVNRVDAVAKAIRSHELDD